MVLKLRDYSKTFDIVSYKLMLTKLARNSVGATVLEMLSSYFSKRSQVIAANVAVSGQGGKPW